MTTLLKRSRVKTSKQFGKDADVKVVADDCAWNGHSGRIVNGVMTMDGKYLVDLGPSYGSQYIYADEMELVEEEEAPAATPPGAIRIDAIHPDPNQPRRHFDDAKLQELADDIRQDGVLQAILVRPHYTLPVGHYMIVFGERRWRAARLAGLESIPANVRKMDDERAAEVQVIENLHRENMHPLEEAHAFQAMRHRFSTEEIAARIGKGKTYVLVRLRLNHLTEEVQQIFLQGHITFEQAQLLARAATEVQEQIIRESKRFATPGESGWNLASLPEMIRKSERNLSLASFDISDASLFAEAGACTTCAHNSAMNELFGDSEGSTCNKPSCYAIKLDRHYKAKLQEAAAVTDGSVVLVSNYAYSESDRQRVKAAQDMGLPVLKDGAIRLISREPEPTLDDIMAKHPGLSQALAEAHFRHRLEGWKTLQNEIAKAEAEGRLKKAYIVAGNNAGSFQEVIVAKQQEPAPVSKGVKNLLKEIDEEQGAGKAPQAFSPTAVRTLATMRYTDLLREESQNFLLAGDLTGFEAAETAAVLYLWDKVRMENESLLVPMKKEFGFQENESISAYENIQLYNKVRLMGMLERGALLGNLARAAVWEDMQSYGAGDYETEVNAAMIRALAFEVNRERAREINQEVIAQLEAQPKPMLRSERGRNLIKYADVPGCWKKLEGPFETEEALDARYQELLSTGNYIQG